MKKRRIPVFIHGMFAMTIYNKGKKKRKTVQENEGKYNKQTRKQTVIGIGDFPPSSFLLVFPIEVCCFYKKFLKI